MTSKQRWLGMGALVVWIAAIGFACGPSETEDKDLCAGVICADSASTCDPVDGECRCGTGDNRIECKSSEICETDPSPTCIAASCAGVTCERGEACDPVDGLCKCGTSSCSGEEECVQNRCVVRNACHLVECPEGQTCDPNDGGQCKCGGDICLDNERCDDDVCVPDPCKGVYCGPTSFCNPEDSACHCGSVTGPACPTGQSCVFQDQEYMCDVADLCADKDCRAGTICDPDDGMCRCGGFGILNPICAVDEITGAPTQICVDGSCIGGDLCSVRETPCGPGFTCSTVDGECKCGDVACNEDQTCMALGEGGPECVKQCDPNVLGAGTCGTNMACYVDFSMSTTIGYCAPVGSIKAGDACETAHSCENRATCVGVDDPKCRKLCNKANSDADCNGVGIVCVQVDNETKIGWCLPT